jgi:hypothetical protein
MTDDDKNGISPSANSQIGGSDEGGIARRSGEADDAKLVLELLSSGYKLLQEKVDKNGAFRFTVKGWSVTLVIASTFAMGANRNVEPRILLFLIVFVMAFGMLELKQARLSTSFGRRLLELEREFPKVRRILQPDSKRRIKIDTVPGIAYQLHDDARRRARSRWWSVPDRLGFLVNPDLWFYIVQVVAVIGAVVALSLMERAGSSGGPQIAIIENGGSVTDQTLSQSSGK